MHIAKFAFLFALTTALTAQTQAVHGRVDGVSGTNPQRFVLRCTNIPMRSATLDLNAMQGQFWQFQVVDVGAPGAPVLDVRSATPLAGTFDMGNLRIGDSNRWTVHAPAGSFALIALDTVAATGYRPFGSAGTWLLGGGAATLALGTTAANNQFEIRVTVPQSALPFVGTELAGQGLIVTSGQPTFTNSECKTIETR